MLDMLDIKATRTFHPKLEVNLMCVIVCLSLFFCVLCPAEMHRQHGIQLP